MIHKKFGSSTAARTDECTLWVQQSEGIPRKESSYAIDGTIVHGILEAYALEEPVPDIVEGHRVEKEHIELADDMWTAAQDVMEKYSLVEWEPEVFASTAEDVGGTLDLVGTDGKGLCMLLDHKSGRGVGVEAVGNKQLLFAAANALYGDCPAGDLVAGCTKFVGVIIQPNQAGEIQTKVWEFTRDVLDAWWEKHQIQIKKARCGEGEFKAGDWCKWCPANCGLCPATNGDLLRAKQLDADDVEDLTWVLDHMNQIETTLSNAKKLAFEQLEVGVKIPGWKLVPGRAGNTTWDDPEAALKKLKRLLRGRKDEDGNRLALQLETKKFVTPTQAKKILKQGEVDSKFLDEITHRPPAKGSVLAPADDPREAVLSSDAFAQAINSIK